MHSLNLKDKRVAGPSILSKKWDFLYYGPMCMSVKKAAQSLIKTFQVDEGLLNMIKMAFTAYDPCMAWVIPYSAP